MSRKNPLPESERAIGRRLVELRDVAGLSRAELVKLCRLTHDLITRVELGITPLRYADATRWLPALVPRGRITLAVNPLWLTDGDAWRPKLEWPLLLPEPGEIGLPSRIRFSAFVANHRELLEGLTKEPPESVLPKSWLFSYAGHFTASLSRLIRIERGVAWLYWVFKNSGARFAGKSPEVAQLMKNARRGQTNSSIQLLTKRVGYDTVSEMVTLLKLRAELKALTAGYGRKTELAKFLGVTRTTVSRWIVGGKEPGGEVTLKLLNWVEQQKEQQKSPGSVPPPPERKAQSAKVPYENKRKESKPVKE